MTRTAANNLDQIAEGRKEGDSRKEGGGSEAAAVSSSIFREGREVVKFNLVSIDGVSPRPRLPAWDRGMAALLGVELKK